MKKPRSSRAGSSSEGSVSLRLLMVGGALFCALGAALYAAAPSWWVSSGAVNSGLTRDDSAVVNEGQLKQFTSKAVGEMNTYMPAVGSGTALGGMVSAWETDYSTNGYSGTNPKPSDFQVINVGQLKYIGHLVWNQLEVGGYTGTTPSWIVVNSAVDNNAANIGQLKTVFNFDLRLDSDSNSIPDWWEEHYFSGSLLGGGATILSPNGDGLSNLQNYEQGINPQDYYNGALPTLTIYSGTNQSAVAGQELASPLVVKITGTGGAVLSHAPVQFSVSASNGQIALTGTGSQSTSQTAVSGTDGLASVSWWLGSSGTVNHLLATVTTGTLSASGTFTANILTPALVIAGGNYQAGVPGTYLDQPLSIEVLSGTTPLANIPVTFTLASGSGALASGTSSSGTATTFTGTSGTNGIVAAYFQQGSGTGVTSTITVASGTASSSFTAKTTRSDGLWAEWKFDEGSGTIAHESTGFTVDGTFVNSPTWSTGFDGRAAINLSGSAYLNMGYVLDQSLDLGFDSFSIAFWGKYGANNGLVLDYGFGEGGGGYGVGFGPTALSVGVGDGGTSANWNFQAPRADDGKWHHIVVVINRLNSTGRVYVDGVAQALVVAGAVGTVDHTDHTLVEQMSTTANSTTGTSSRFIIGSFEGINSRFNGQLEDFRIYRKALSGTEVANLHNVDSDANGLPDWWEYQYFTQLGISGTADSDHDGLINSQEYSQGSDPTNYYSQGTATIIPSVSIVAGNNQMGVSSAYLAQSLSVQVRSGSSGGTLLVNAPVTFSLTSGGGGLATVSGSGTTQSSVNVLTGSNGIAQAYFETGTATSGTMTITAASGTAAVTFTAHADNTTSFSRNGLAVWLRADQGVSGSGSNVNQWTDMSGSGNSAAQATSGDQPLLASSVVNGKPVIRFDGSDDVLNIADSASLKPAQMTVFVIGKANGTNGNLLGTYVKKEGPWTTGFGLARQNTAPSTGFFINDSGTTIASGTAGALSGTWSQSLTIYPTQNNAYGQNLGSQAYDAVCSGTALFVIDFDTPTIFKIRADSYLLTSNTAAFISWSTSVSGSNNYGSATGTGAYLKNFGICADDSAVYVANYSAGRVVKLNQSDLSYVGDVGVGIGPRRLALSGTTLYVVNSGTNDDSHATDTASVMAIDPSTMTVTGTYPVGGVPYGICADGQGGLYISTTGTLTKMTTSGSTVWNAATAQTGTSFNKDVVIAGENVWLTEGDPLMSGTVSVEGFTATTGDKIGSYGLGTTMMSSSGTAFTPSGAILSESIAYDGRSLWVNGYNNSVENLFQMDLSGTILNRWYLDGSRHRSIAVDAANNRIWTPSASSAHKLCRLDNYFSDGSFNVLEGRYDGTELEVFQNGVISGTYATSATVSYSGSDALTIGSGTGGLNALQGDIAEVLIFNRALSGTERQGVENYLASRYAIIGPLGSPLDSDNNGLPDAWESANFSAIGQDPNADPDHDGLTNLQEYEAGSNPNDYYNGTLPTFLILSGNNQIGPAGQQLPFPLTIKVTGTAGNAFNNAPVQFAVSGSGGMIAFSGTGTQATTQSAITGTDGSASVYWWPAGISNSTVHVVASATTAGQTVTGTFAATIASPVLVIAGGNNQIGLPGDYLASPLSVEVRSGSSTGTLLADVPVTFSLSSGTGGLAAASGSGTTSGTFNATSGTDGVVQAYFQQGLLASGSNAVTATSGSSTVTFGMRTVGADGLSSEWKFSDGSGTIAIENTGYSVSGTLVSGTAWTTGFDGNGALSFSGSNYVTMGNPSNQSLDFGGGSFSVSLWIKCGDITLSGSSSVHRLVSKGHKNWNSGYLVGIDGSGHITAGLGSTQTGTASEALYFSTSGSFNDGAWHHVTAAFDAAAEQAEIYVDGSAQLVSPQMGAGGTSGTGCITFSSLHNLNATSNEPFTVGSYSGTSDFFNGQIEDVRLYRKALSGLEAADLYATGYQNNVTQGLAVWLKADQGVVLTGSTVSQWADQSGSGNNAAQATAGAQPKEIDNQINSEPILRFDGVDDYMSVADNAGLRPSQVTAFFVGKYKTGGSSPTLCPFVVKGPYSGGFTNGFGLIQYNFYPRMYISDWRGPFATTTGTLAADAPLIMWGRYDSSQITLSISGSITTTSSAGPLSTNTGPILLGGLDSEWFQGDIAEVLYYTHALNDTEINHVENYLYRRYHLGNPPAAVAPILVPGSSSSGIYQSAQTILVTVPFGETVQYTTDGTEPTNSSPTYDGLPMAVSNSEILKFKAFKSGQPESSTLMLNYTIDSSAGFPHDGLMMWLRSDAQVTTGTWSDQSGHGNDAVQSATTSQPIVVANAINGQPVVHFDGTNDYLTVADPAMAFSGSQVTVFVVGQQTSGTATSAAYVARAASVSGTVGYGLGLLGSGTMGFYVNGTATNRAKGPQSTASYSLLTGRFTGTSVDFFQNGGTDTPFSFSGSIKYAAGPLLIGCSGTTSSTNLAGNIAEVLVYNRALGNTERQSVESYLNQRYNSNPLNPTFNRAPYTITLSSGTNSFMEPANVTLTVSSTASGINHVDLYQGGMLLGSGTGVPYTYSLAALTAGNYQFTAVSSDASGMQAAASLPLQVTPPFTVSSSNRYIMGPPSDPSHQVFVIALDSEKGIQLNPTGDNADKFPSGAPWFMRIASTGTAFFTTVTTSGSTTSLGTSIPFENPLVAFGSASGGSSLFAGQTYSFGIAAGAQFTGTDYSSVPDVVIDAYPSGSFSSTSSGVVPVISGTIHLPRPTDSNWDDFVKNGYVTSNTTANLTTTIQYLTGGPSVTELWGQLDKYPFVITHKASSADYKYKVSVAGGYIFSNINLWTAYYDYPSVAAYGLRYTLDFDAASPWTANIVAEPNFQGVPLPSAYQGKTLDELIHGAPPVSDTLSALDSSGTATLTTLNASPELHQHPILDQFVADMGNDPIALANYVLNEIDLTNAMGYTTSGTIGEVAINPTGVSRGALATFLEGAGNPTEQCALLIYLLRKAGVPCEYVFPQHNLTLMFDQQLSKLLRMQLHGAKDYLGNSNVPQLIPVNYPWVAANINGKWVHIFPWLKDTAVEEGNDLFKYLPADYQTGRQWVNKYLLNDPPIRSLSKKDDPATLFPLFVQHSLATSYPDVSISQLGVNIYNRRNYFTSWDQFPRPWQTPTISGSNVVTGLSSISNIFDTVNISVAADSGSATLNTGTMSLVDLSDRRLLLYFQQQVSGTNTTGYQMTLSLDSFRPGTSGTGTFGGGADLTLPQAVSIPTGTSDNAIQFAVDVRRHRQVDQSLSTTDQWTPFLGFNEFTEISGTRPLQKGDMAALCFDYGHVSQKMLEVQAEKYWAYQQQVQNQSSSVPVDPELAIGTPLYLMGLTYYYKVSQFGDTLEALTKTHDMSIFGFGFAKLGAKRNAQGGLLNGAISLVYPKVDMMFYELAIAGNGTLHPDSGDEWVLPIQSASQLFLVNSSAQEHVTINQFFQQSAAISTVKLLDIAQGWTTTSGSASTPGSHVVILTGTSDIATTGATNYSAYLSGTSGTATTKALKDWAGGTSAGSMWSSVTNALNGSEGEDTFVILTPGPETGANGDYVGMGGMILGVSSDAALIDDNKKVSNGGAGRANNYSFQTISLPVATVTQSYLTPSSDGGYSFASTVNYTPPAPTYVAPASSIQNFDSIYSGVSGGSFAFDPVQQSTLAQFSQQINNVSLVSPSNSTLASVYQAAQNIGYVGSTSYYGDSFGSIVSKAVSDPVNSVTGEFYIDALDLKLNGPMPLEIRRNYGSLNTADNNFGYGWKMAYFPYLVVSPTTGVIYAAEMDGSVVAYRSGTSSSTHFVPTGSDNPQLNNVSGDSMGSTTNLFNNHIDETTSGTNTTYTLTGADGSVRTFCVQSFPIVSSGTGATDGLTRQRPYLQKWGDNRGNYYTFSYGTNAAAVDYGQLNRAVSSNGNYVGFDYDTYGHIVEAYAGDGRRLTYQYNGDGDLIQVTQPDGSTLNYDYLQASGTAGDYSTHLIMRETKPEGRILENDYDSSRRVTTQRSTVGTSAAPVQNAAFGYSGTTNSDGTITGTTTITDINSGTMTYRYTNSLITQTTDELGHSLSQDWYFSGTGTGAYQRSLKTKTDKRGLQTAYQYDSSGNVVQIVLTGTLTGTGGGSENSTTTMTYNTGTAATVTLPGSGLSMIPNTLASVTDPIGNSMIYTYGNSSYPLLPTSIEKRAPGGSISTTTFQYTNAGSGSSQAYGVLSQETLAAGSSDQAVTTYANNGNGFVVSKTQLTGDSDPPVTTNYTYNLRGELSAQTDAAGRTINYAYDDLGHQIWAERHDAGGALVGWSYNYYNQNGDLSWTQGSRSSPEDYIYRQYDFAGRMNQEINWRSRAKADGSGVEAVPGDDQYATTFYNHDGFGNLTEIDDPRHNATTMTYDAIGQMLTRTVHNGSSTASAVATESFGYSAGGDVISSTNAIGGVETGTYASTGQLLADRKPDGTVHSFNYDLSGRVVKEVLANGSYWSTAYDDFDRTVTKTLHSSGGTTLATNSVTLDRRGNVVTKVDGEGFATTMTYDGLNRLKTVTGPASSGNSAGQTLTHIYDAAGIVDISRNGLGEATTTTYDALRRPVLEQVSSSSGQTVRSEGYFYSPDHQSVTTVDGTHTGMTTTFTDLQGQTVLVKNADNTFNLSAYDANENLVQNVDELSRATSYQYDALNRPTQETLPDGAQTTFTYDAAGNLLSRQMPGGLTWSGTYNAASQKLAEHLSSGTSTTRASGYSYYQSTGTGAYPGMLATGTDPRGIVSTYTYDGFGHVAQIAAVDSGTNQLGVTVSYTYDRRDLVTQIDQAYQNSALSPPTSVRRSYDGYGSLASEQVLISGTTVDSWQATHDAAGRRTQLLETNFSALPFTYSYRADGLLASAGFNGASYTYDYGTDGLLTARTTPVHGQHIVSRDATGRITEQTEQVSGTTILDETAAWRGDSTQSSYAIARSGTTENRSYSYDSRGHVTSESFAPVSGGSGTMAYQFDQSGTAGLGLRTGVSLTGALSGTYSGSFNGLARLSSFATSGSLTGSLGTPTNQTFDAEGQLVSHQPSSNADTLTWDALGHLISLQRNPSGTGFLWSAVYDGLGRRLQTTQQAISGGSSSGSPLVIHTSYDPSVEFLPLATTINGQRDWLVHGPDLNGQYGGLQGTGGLEAVVSGTAGTTAGVVSDIYGHTEAVVTGTNTVAWNPVRSTGYGPQPGTTAQPLDATHDLPIVIAWRGHYVDGTGYYYLGTRYYDPQTGGFVSPDPLGHIASMDLYSYCGGDPINSFDADGRFGVNSVSPTSNSTSYSPNSIGAQLQAQWDYQSALADGLDRFYAPADNVLKAAAFSLIPVVGEYEIAAVGAETIGAIGEGLEAWAASSDLGSLAEGGGVTADASSFVPVEQAVAASPVESSAINESFVAAGQPAANAPIPAVEMANPSAIRFSQPTISQNFSSKGTINDLVAGLKDGSTKVTDVPAIRVVERDDQVITLDNRRLAAFQTAGVDSIPAQRLSLSDPKILEEFLEKYNPINGGRNIVVTPNAAGRKAAEALLRKHGKIK